jgi:hypothetical protein
VAARIGIPVVALAPHLAAQGLLRGAAAAFVYAGIHFHGHGTGAQQFAAAALKVADYGYVLENGRITAQGPADKLKNDPAVKAAYLGGGH